MNKPTNCAHCGHILTSNEFRYCISCYQDNEDLDQGVSIMSDTSVKSVNVENHVKSVLDEKFIKTEDVAAILSLAFQGNKNVIFYGPAGHGKSEMVSHITNAIIPKRCSHVCEEDICNDHEDENCTHVHSTECQESGVFTQSFGEGMDESMLWGGIDFKYLEEHKKLRYAPQDSFLNYECAVFEEIFDAPATVILSLKDTLTAKILRKGEQQFKMKTRCIIALTNREPQEISDLGPAAHALIERFPLQYNLKWDSYTEKDYRSMFNKRYERKHTEIKTQLASIIAVAVEKGSMISPRTAMHALEVCIVNEDRGSDAYNCLKFVPGFEGIMDNIHQEIYESKIRREAVASIFALDNSYDDACEMLCNAKDISEVAKSVKELKRIDGELEVLALPDDLYERRNELRDKIKDALNLASDSMMTMAQAGI